MNIPVTSSDQSQKLNSLLKIILENSVRNPLRFVGWVFIALLLFVSINNIDSETPRQLLQQLIFGLSQGSIYALIALGYTLVYGILFMINFAHGEVFMSGAYMGFFTIYAMEQSGFLAEQTLLALILTIIAGALASLFVAITLERVAYRPLRNAPRLVPLITAIGASFTLQQLFLLLFGSGARRYPDVSLYVLPQVFREECSITDGVEVCKGLDIVGGLYEVELLDFVLRIRPISFIVFFVSLGLMAALWFVIQNTKTGRAMRAVAEDKDASRLMGINVDTTIMITFALGGLLAGAGAVMFALIPGNGQITPFMGFLPGIKAFTAAVVGGIGNVRGAMAGGLFIGVAEAIGPSLLGLDNQLKELIVFGLLILILIFRPTGIFGEVLSEKRV